MTPRKNKRTNDDAAHQQMDMTPTQMVGLFRQRILDGIFPLPFSEGVTEAMREKHATILLQRAKGIV